jgi:hypothetical protein
VRFRPEDGSLSALLRAVQPAMKIWTLDDPTGQGIDVVRPIRDQVRGRVEQLIQELLGEGAQAARS